MAEAELLKFLWGVLLVPIGWLWKEISSNKKQIYELEKQVAGMPTRAELREAIKDAIAPLQTGLSDIKGDLQNHHREEIDRYDRILRAIEERQKRRDE